MNVITRVRQFIGSGTAALLSVGALVLLGGVAIWLHLSGDGESLSLLAMVPMLLHTLHALKGAFGPEWTEDGQKVQWTPPETRPRHPTFRVLYVPVLLLFVVGLVVGAGRLFAEEAHPWFTKENFWVLLTLAFTSHLALIQLGRWWDLRSDERLLRSDV